MVTYSGDTVTETTGKKLVVKKVNAKNNLLLYQYDILYIDDEHTQTSTNIYIRDSNLNVLNYKKYSNKELVKEGIHYFRKDGKEDYQIEKFFNPDYKIITKFHYEYW
jgi:hypothetical protein